MFLKIIQCSLCCQHYKIKLEIFTLDDNESSESGKQKINRSKEKKRLEKYPGTVQDIGWCIPEDPDDCDREDIYRLNRVQEGYEEDWEEYEEA